jgi:hypothetical protein
MRLWPGGAGSFVPTDHGRAALEALLSRPLAVCVAGKSGREGGHGNIDVGDPNRTPRVHRSSRDDGDLYGAMSHPDPYRGRAASLLEETEWTAARAEHKVLTGEKGRLNFLYAASGRAAEAFQPPRKDNSHEVEKLL